MYHEIYKAEERDRLRSLTNPAYNTEIDVFRRQMAWLFANNVKTPTIDDLLSQKSPSEERAICLTFDDGWLGNYLHAYPILKEYEFKATFFIATDLIGKPFYMTWEDIKEIAASGMSIQSHTVTHRPLAHMGGERVLFELSESKRVIEERLGQEVRHLSLPHGIKDERIWNLAQGIGYKSICTSNVGFQTWESDGPWFRRISIGNGVSEKKFELIVQGKNRAIWGMMIIKSLKNILRGTIGANTYRKLYQRIYGIR
jgi:peptidoglycan/xylan/chitin deacetylase (PgdA/CDA1 family)